jgi:hypothetical protein
MNAVLQLTSTYLMHVVTAALLIPAAQVHSRFGISFLNDDPKSTF